MEAKKDVTNDNVMTDGNGHIIDTERDNPTGLQTGDKVLIKCGETHKNVAFIYDGKIGTVEGIWTLDRNPWGNIPVRITGGYNNTFYPSELTKVEDNE